MTPIFIDVRRLAIFVEFDRLFGEVGIKQKQRRRVLEVNSGVSNFEIVQ